MIAANDNVPRRAGEFKTTAERIAYLDSLPKGNPDPVLAWPTLTRLKRAEGNRRLGLLIQWRDLNAPARLFDVANDNPVAHASEWTDDVRPSIETLMANAAPLADGKEFGDDGSFYIRTSGLRFFAGETPPDKSGRLHSFMTATGKWREPFEMKGKPKGGKHAVKGTGRPANTGQPLDDLERRGEAAAARKRLGTAAQILDMALTDATADEIGIAFGRSKGGKSAERIGVRIIDDALDQFEKLAA